MRKLPSGLFFSGLFQEALGGQANARDDTRKDHSSGSISASFIFSEGSSDDTQENHGETHHSFFLFYILEYLPYLP
jgi:hypothetical protein